jgi:hypothetical protein
MNNTVNSQSDDLPEEAKKLLEEFEAEMTAASQEMIAAIQEEEKN